MLVLQPDSEFLRYFKGQSKDLGQATGPVKPRLRSSRTSGPASTRGPAAGPGPTGELGPARTLSVAGRGLEAPPAGGRAPGDPEAVLLSDGLPDVDKAMPLLE